MAGYNDYRNPGSATVGNEVDGTAPPAPSRDGRFYVNPRNYTGDHRAANINAALTRETLREWMERYAPMGEELAGDLRGGQRLSDGMQGVNIGLGKAFAQADAADARRRSRYGVTLSGQHKQAAETGRGLSRDATAAMARNGVRDIVGQADDELIAGM